MESSSRDGWIAMHGHDYRRAAELLGDAPGPGRPGFVRARLLEATLQADLQRLEGAAAERLFSDWAARGALPPAGAAVAELAARCSRGGEHASPDTDPALTAHEAAHEAARAGDVGPILAAASGPLLVERGADGEVTHTWYDPCVHATLAVGFAAGTSWPADATGWSDPAASLFAPWPSYPDLGAELADDPDFGSLGDAPPSLAPLGLPDDDADTAGTAQDYVRALDAHLDAIRRDLAANADADGLALLQQVDPVHRWRQEHLVARARGALRAGRAQHALTTLILAQDVTDRTIGPRNSPALMALLAEANLRTGRTREALDALLVLSRARPEVRGLQELVGDLAVMDGLDRRGDSKEH